MIDFMMLFSLWVVGYMYDKCYDVDSFVGGGLHRGFRSIPVTDELNSYNIKNHPQTKTQYKTYHSIERRCRMM
jgi:hypothetical protein